MNAIVNVSRVTDAAGTEFFSNPVTTFINNAPVYTPYYYRLCGCGRCCDCCCCGCCCCGCSCGRGPFGNSLCCGPTCALCCCGRAQLICCGQ